MFEYIENFKKSHFKFFSFLCMIKYIFNDTDIVINSFLVAGAELECSHLTAMNYAVQLSTFGEIAGVITSGVQGINISL